MTALDVSAKEGISRPAAFNKMETSMMSNRSRYPMSEGKSDYDFIMEGENPALIKQ